MDQALDVKKRESIDRKKGLLSTRSEHPTAQTFTFRELAAATKNFRADCLLGEGGFGRVYKGSLESIKQVCFCFSIISFLMGFSQLSNYYIPINYCRFRLSSIIIKF